MKTDEVKAGKPRCIVLSGFLGAGKTAAILRLGSMLKARHRIGVITNDEGTDLVDTLQLRASGFPVEEIPGGAFATQPEACFAAAHRLISGRCDILLGECAGTSADLRAGFLQALQQRLGASITVAPLSVVVDAVRAGRVLHRQSGSSFSERLTYIYRKQLEEAEILAINKCDLLSAGQLATLRKALSEIAPHATLLEVSTRTGAGFDEWLNLLLTKDHTASPVATPMDAEVFSEAESLLGWLNCTVKVSSVKYFDACKLLTHLAIAIQSLLKQDGREIAHLKILLRTVNESTGASESATANLVRNDSTPEISGDIPDPVQRAELTLNLRAEAKPDFLHTAVNQAVLEIMERSPELFARMEHCEHFSLSRKGVRSTS